MGEFAVARTSGVLRTLLGSCLGLALYDRRFKVAGLGHIVLPQAQGRTDIPGKFADTAIPAIICQMQKLVDEKRLQLHAKIAGGANMFTSADSSNCIALGGESQQPIIGEWLA